MKYISAIIACMLALCSQNPSKAQTFSIAQLKYTSSGYNSISGGSLFKLDENSFVSLRDGNKEMSVDVFELGSEEPDHSFMIDKKEDGQEKQECEIRPVGENILFIFVTHNKVVDRCTYYAEIRNRSGVVIHAKKEVARHGGSYMEYSLIQSPDKQQTILYFDPFVLQLYVARAGKPEFEYYNISHELEITTTLLVHGIKNLAPKSLFLSNNGTLSFLWSKSATGEDVKRNSNLKDKSVYGYMIHKAKKTVKEIKVAELNNCIHVKAVQLDNGKIALSGIYRKNGKAIGPDHILYFELNPETDATDNIIQQEINTKELEKIVIAGAASDKELKKLNKSLGAGSGLNNNTECIGIYKGSGNEIKLIYENLLDFFDVNNHYQLVEFSIKENELQNTFVLPKIQDDPTYMGIYNGPVILNSDKPYYLFNANPEPETIAGQDKYKFSGKFGGLSCVLAAAASESNSVESWKILCNNPALVLAPSTALVFNKNTVIAYLVNPKTYDNVLISINLESLSD